MYRLTLHLDAELLATHGPEVQWAWRTLLTGLGYAWQVVDGRTSDCDVAHTADPVVRGRARVSIDAAAARWAGGTALRLAGLADHGEWVVPRYDRGDDGAPPVGDHGAPLRIRRDVIFDAFWLATGQEEPAFARNAHGHLDLDGSPYLTEGTLRRAVASGIGASLQRALIGQGLPPPLPRWPHGKRAAAAGTHDVDYPEVIRWLEPLRVVARQGLRGVAAACAVAAGRRSHWQFDAWTAAERHHGVRSAFYFVARQGSLTEYASGTPDSFYDIGAPRFRELFARLRDAGVEIGLHASYRAYERPERLAAEKHRLETASGVTVLGNRHHYWHLDPRDPEATLRSHGDVGLVYDSSLFHDRYVGWRRGLCWPYFPFHQGDRRAVPTLQLPTAWMDDQLFGQQARNPGDPAQTLGALVDCVAAQGGLLIADIHDYVYDDALFPGWSRLYLSLLERLAVRGDFWLATPAEIAGHWVERASALAAASLGLDAGAPDRRR